MTNRHDRAAYTSPLFTRRSASLFPRRTTTRFSSSGGGESQDEKNQKKDDLSSSNIVPSNSTRSSSSSSSKSMGEKFDDFGQSLKPKALDKKQERQDATTTKHKVWLTIQVCGLFLGFLLYRAYRGFFILLPAVFREVYRKLEDTYDSPFVEEPGVQDINPDTGKVRWRTRITVSVLAAVVTMTYVIGGIMNVVVKFVKSLLSTTSATSSFEAAANEAQTYEEYIRKMAKKNDTKINDDKSSGPLGP